MIYFAAKSTAVVSNEKSNVLLYFPQPYLYVFKQTKNTLFVLKNVCTKLPQNDSDGSGSELSIFDSLIDSPAFFNRCCTTTMAPG